VTLFQNTVALACSAMLAPIACSKAPTPLAPCTMKLGADATYDLVLDGTGQCGASVKLSLRIATGDPDAPQWSDRSSAPLRVEGDWALAAGGAIRSLRVTNTGTTAVNLVGLEWSAEHLALGADRFLHSGYQSWSYAGVETIPDVHADHLGTAPHGGDNEDTLDELPGVSWWVAALSDEKGKGLVAGADGATVFKTYLAADGSRLRIVEGLTGDAVTIGPGASLALDGLYVVLGDVAAGLDAYASHVAALHAPSTPRRPPLGGWGSWNLYYDRPTGDLVRQEISWAKDHLAPVGLKDFLLDDGYESHWGSWSAKSAFGADLGSLGREEAALTLVPAVWLAPFYVDSSDVVVAQHPEWFVHRKDGTIRTFANFGSATSAPLDMTQAGARAFVVDQVKALRAAGYRTFKIDFLFGGAIEGVRSEPITGVQAYALGMKTLRDAVPDAHLVGCGAPILPSVGWVDSMRTGADIAFITSPLPTFPFLMSEARSSAMRAFTDAWWAIDPDVVLLRGARLSDAEAWTAVVSAALTGGNYLLGDARQAGDLRAGMALDPNVLAITRDGIAARPVDLLSSIDAKLYPSPLLAVGDTAVPHVWSKTSRGAVHWIAVFGWQGDPSFSTDLDLPRGAVELVAPAAPGPVTLRPTEGHVHVEVLGHNARLFRLAP
jgi:alpha-galactosidase